MPVIFSREEMSWTMMPTYRNAYGILYSYSGLGEQSLLLFIEWNEKKIKIRIIL